jgi:hypothetical protein
MPKSFAITEVGLLLLITIFTALSLNSGVYLVLTCLLISVPQFQTSFYMKLSVRVSVTTPTPINQVTYSSSLHTLL